MSAIGSTVHPHAGGENLSLKSAIRAESGSPPRGWGKRSSCLRRWQRPRFTPTRVGKTSRIPTPRGITTVHPHAGGENHHRRGANEPHDRFTPTRVGKTRSPDTERLMVAVHPHAGGENDLG